MIVEGVERLSLSLRIRLKKRLECILCGSYEEQISTVDERYCICSNCWNRLLDEYYKKEKER